MEEAQQNFWTKLIRLEEISRREFNALRRGWGIPEHTKNDTYALIRDPLARENYTELIAKFLEHPAAKNLKVREEGPWQKYFPAQITGQIADAIANYAENDRLGYDTFEMKFKPVQPNAEGIRERAKMMFREAGDLILGYEISVHRDNLSIFDSRISCPREHIISAIADPMDFI